MQLGLRVPIWLFLLTLYLQDLLSYLQDPLISPRLSTLSLCIKLLPNTALGVSPSLSPSTFSSSIHALS